MIIDTKTIIITFITIVIAAYIGLRFIRSFALTIAQENHAANLALDSADELQRLRRMREADEMVANAFSNVEPLVSSSTMANIAKKSHSHSQSELGGGLTLTKGTGSSSREEAV